MEVTRANQYSLSAPKGDKKAKKLFADVVDLDEEYVLSECDDTHDHYFSDDGESYRDCEYVNDSEDIKHYADKIVGDLKDFESEYGTTGVYLGICIWADDDFRDFSIGNTKKEIKDFLAKAMLPNFDRVGVGSDDLTWAKLPRITHNVQEVNHYKKALAKHLGISRYFSNKWGPYVKWRGEFPEPKVTYTIVTDKSEVGKDKIFVVDYKTAKKARPKTAEKDISIKKGDILETKRFGNLTVTEVKRVWVSMSNGWRWRMDSLTKKSDGVFYPAYDKLNERITK